MAAFARPFPADQKTNALILNIVNDTQQPVESYDQMSYEGNRWRIKQANQALATIVMPDQLYHEVHLSRFQTRPGTAGETEVRP